jgi:hypothetical protein
MFHLTATDRTAIAYHWPVRWMRGAFLLIVCCVFFAIPGEALAITLAPPGKAGADQYFETIPNPSGNAAPPGSVPGSGGSGSAGLSHLGSGSTGAARLAKLGPDGQKAAAVAAATAPTPAGGNATAQSTTAGNTTGGKPGRSGASHVATIPQHRHSAGDTPTSALANALTGSGGLGLVLPLLLGTSLVLGLGLVISRARRGAQPPELGA